MREERKALSWERARLIDSGDIGLSLALKVFFPLSSDYQRAVQATRFLCVFFLSYL